MKNYQGLYDAATKILIGESGTEEVKKEEEKEVQLDEQVEDTSEEDSVEQAEEQEADDQEIDESVTVEFNIELQESYTFGEYLTAAKELYGEEEAIDIANAQYNAAALDVFAEQVTRDKLEKQVDMYHKQGHKVSRPKIGIHKDGQMTGEYTVTNKDTGVRTRYFHHGKLKRVQNLGAPGKTDMGDN